eukprot:6599986-Pyramimonas_sp.AAC.1
MHPRALFGQAGFARRADFVSREAAATEIENVRAMPAQGAVRRQVLAPPEALLGSSAKAISADDKGTWSMGAA